MLAVALAPTVRTTAADNFFVQGTLRDVFTNVPLVNACVSLGPPTGCAAATDVNGYYRIDLPAITTPEYSMTWSKEGYQPGYSGKFTVNGSMTFTNWLFPGAGTCPRVSASQTVYLPNITKTLGGPTGFQTPFIVQNVSKGTITTLTLDFYRFSDGSLVTTKQVCAVRPGTSFALVPNNEADLPDDTQFAVVVNAWQAPVVAVVNEHAGIGDRAEAASYVGASSGATSVFLPNITKRFFGYVTPFIIQNLGTSTTVATASFTSFDGTRTATLQRTIPPGRSQFVNPNVEPFLVDGTQYAVTVTSAQPVSVVVNTQNDAPDVAAPVFYATNGLTTGTATLYAPYAVKGVPGVGKGVSTVVVQNLATTAVTATLELTPLGGGAKTSFTGPSLAVGASWAFDPRYTNGDTKQPFCGTAPTTGCLPNGEYSLIASGPARSQLAAVVNVIGDVTAAGYTALSAPTGTSYLPNVTKTLGGNTGWTTPLVLQSATATSVTVSWYRFSDGSLVTTQMLTFVAGTAQRIDPRDLVALPDGTQFSVVAVGNDGTLAGIVTELNFMGGDGAMFYEWFAR